MHTCGLGVAAADAVSVEVSFATFKMRDKCGPVNLGNEPFALLHACTMH